VLFVSAQFFAFLCLVLALYWFLPWRGTRTWLLLISSFYFYASWNQWLACLVSLSAAVDYTLARLIEITSRPKRRRLLVSISIVSNLGLLAYFKYANFFLDSLALGLCRLGCRVSMPTLQIIVPIGISFYTFEAINYTVDVYRGRIRAERNLKNFMLFILFFPHLVAGPIVRARDFLPQIQRAKHWSWPRFHLGVQLFLLGMFKKLAIADRMALLADPVFANPANYQPVAVWVAVFAYAIQIYCDFSGYTDMAIGTAHMFGYKLAPNFDLPYLAGNISAFWRRWHMSLSGWLRDYLFIPLGGSRCGAWRTRFNLLVTMTLGGLWHGAAWHFVVWGMVHGLWLTLHRELKARTGRWPHVDRIFESAGGTMLRTAATFLGVCLAWVLFRAPSLGEAITVFKLMIFGGSGSLHLDCSLFWIAAALGLLAQLGWKLGRWQIALRKAPPVALGGAYAAALTVALILAPDATKTFVYFQF
jgi:alginate O-acetyltransferase complex protein AlgI